MYSQEQDEILRAERVDTAQQSAIIAVHHTWAIHLWASYAAGVLRVECRRPVIEGTDWQGQMVETEVRPVLLSIDDSDPVEVPVISGVAEIELVWEAPGTYQIRVAADYGCEPGGVEVTV